MAKLRGGFFGDISGSVGNVTFSRRNGETTVSQKRGKSKTPPTESQLAQHLRWQKTMELVGPMKELVRDTFPAKGMSGFNKATSANTKKAIVGAYPDLTIDYSLALVSGGSLPNEIDATVSCKRHILTFEWPDWGMPESTRNTDMAIVVAYCPALQEVKAAIGPATRGDQKAQLDVSAFAKREVHIYLAFITADKKKASDSVYLGKMQL